MVHRFHSAILAPVLVPYVPLPFSPSFPKIITKVSIRCFIKKVKTLTYLLHLALRFLLILWAVQFVSKWSFFSENIFECFTASQFSVNKPQRHKGHAEDDSDYSTHLEIHISIAFGPEILWFCLRDVVEFTKDFVHEQFHLLNCYISIMKRNINVTKAAINFKQHKQPVNYFRYLTLRR